MKIYVGNLSFDVKEEELQSAFADFGKVASVNIIKDRETGRMKGFAFVEMNDDREARAAIAGLNLKDINGRPVTVNEARPREERRGGGGGGRRW